jgi:DNA invertase Pin-like site-specific DNA recombinase
MLGGIPCQKAAIRKWASLNGVHIARWFVDSISGTTDLENRPQLQELIAAANGIRMIIVERLDRVACDLMVQESIILDFKRNGFELVSTAEPDLCSADPSRILMRQVMEAFAQYERAMIVAKTQAAKRRKRETDPDYREGRVPFGKAHGEAETIARILELLAAGMTLTAIAAKLADEKRLTRAGLTVWQPGTVLNVIKRAKS